MGLPLASSSTNFVPVPDPAHQRIVDLLDSNSADHAGDLHARERHLEDPVLVHGLLNGENSRSMRVPP
jgi:hypothetical protein